MVHIFAQAYKDAESIRYFIGGQDVWKLGRTLSGYLLVRKKVSRIKKVPIALLYSLQSRALFQ